MIVSAACLLSVLAAADAAAEMPRYGDAAGQVQVIVAFPEPVSNAPLTFGIPVGQAEAPEHVTLLDGRGRPIPADVSTLGNWESQPARWALISCVVSSPKGKPRRLRVRWGEDAPRSPGGPSAASTLAGGPALGSSCALIREDGEVLRPAAPEITILREGPVHRRVRAVSRPAEGLELHEEADWYAGSPFVRCRSRFINRTVSDIALAGIVPMEMPVGSGAPVTVGLGDGLSAECESFDVVQRAFGWTERVDGTVFASAADDLSEWVVMEGGSGGRLMLVFPHFQEMAAGDDDLESVLSFDGDTLRLHHYRPISDTADVRLRGSMARTFEYWLIVNPEPGTEAALARAVKAMPYVVHDREHLTRMGVFQERSVSRLYDDELLEGALYFLRARVPRAEYLRCGRGTEPGPDKSGEGAYEVDLHAGGMLFGEVFQYFTPEPTEGDIRFYTEELGLSPEHVVTGGRYAYRNGDIPLALWQQYLRTGDARLAAFAPIHTQLFADYAVSHAPQSLGIGHYYCDWYANPYVYQRFEGLLLGYLATGEEWWLESATNMAEYCVRAWRDDDPCDGSLNGGLGGVQTRSPYIAKMLLRLHDVTGEAQYVRTARRLGEWAAKWQEPEGWWTMHPGTGRDFRCTPIFAGYICQGLWPVYKRTGEEALLTYLLRAADWYVEMQEDARGSNPGTFPNSYWYGEHISADNPISGNYATTQHAANTLLQAYRATGEEPYFYSANAAWLSVLNHQTPEGGVPLGNSIQGSVWSHVMVESLPDFAAAAETDDLPIVLTSETGVPGDSFMGKGATYEDGIFTFELKHRSESPLPVRVFAPRKPGDALVNGARFPFDWDRKHRILTLQLTPNADFTVTEVRLELGRER